LAWSIAGTEAAFFNIDTATGVVTFKTSPNFEAPADSGANNIYDIIVQASDGTLNATQDVAITVTDLDEFNVAFASPADIDTSANTVQEGASAGTTVGVTASASDADGTTNAVTYWLVMDATGNTVQSDGPFQINATTGVVTVRDGPLLNYESATSTTIYVKAASADGSTAVQSFNIDITDVNEYAVSTPIDANAAPNSIAENAATDTLVGLTTHAVDADGSNNSGSYWLVTDATGGTIQTGGPFQINASTGVVSVRDGTQLNYETAAQQKIYVKAVSADGSTAVQSFVIGVSDENEAPTGVNLSAWSLAENNAAGAVVATLTATDPDGPGSGYASPFTYTLVAGSGDADNAAFIIVGDQLKIKAAANFESKASYSVRIQVSDAGGLTFATAKSISVTDINEAPTVPS
jgi:hypothetical protein